MAQFSTKKERIEHITRTISKTDLLKFLFYALYELKGLETKDFLILSEKTEEVGKMLYGWKIKAIKELEEESKKK